jgi:hypothetical protein
MSTNDPEVAEVYDLTETLCLRALIVAEKPHSDKIQFTVPFCSLALFRL